MIRPFEQLDPGQGGKEQLINENFSKVPYYLGELDTIPNTNGLPAGCTYFNTIESKLKILFTTGTWSNVQ